jgi:D-alanine-D-alanine ligase-like ATP-grasp enzyme
MRTLLFASARRRVYGAADVLLTAGPRYAWHRLREDATINAQLEAGRNALYEHIWRSAAAEVGAGVRDLGDGFLEIEKGRATTRVWQQFVMLDDAVTLRLALEKEVVGRLLAAENVPLAERLEFRLATIEQALGFLTGSPGGCVVKPTAGTAGGLGTTTGIRTPRDLRRATVRAARFGERLVIEREARGDVYRLLFLDGELIDVVRRLPPRVTGDGDSNVRELVVAESRRRALAGGHAGVEPLRIDLDCALTLRRAGLSARSRLARGETVAVKTVTNQNAPRDNATWRGVPAPEVVENAAAAVRVVGLRLAGVDIVTSDPSVPLQKSGGVLLEVNGKPGLHHHYLVADAGSATPVAVPILQTLLDEAAARGREPGPARLREAARG